MILSKDEAREYGRRGGKARQHEYRYNVEGEYVTTSEICARAGVTGSTVRRRIQACKGPLTWKALGV